MIIMLDTDTHHSFMMKGLKKLGTEEVYLNMMKAYMTNL